MKNAAATLKCIVKENFLLNFKLCSIGVNEVLQGRRTYITYSLKKGIIITKKQTKKTLTCDPKELESASMLKTGMVRVSLHIQINTLYRRCH